MEEKIKIGDVVEAEVIKITDFGAFVKFNERNRGLIHISQISNEFVKDVQQHLSVGDKVKARVIKLGPEKKIDLTLKTSFATPVQKNTSSLGRLSPAQQAAFKSSDFEEKLKTFLQE